MQRLRREFVWWSGTEARQFSIDAACDKDYRIRERWETGFSNYLLIIDDISQPRFTKAWSAALFGLLETRLANLKPVIWTSQLTEEELFDKITGQNGGDSAQAAAICRRLFQHSLIIHV